jgi:hypothetical protein
MNRDTTPAPAPLFEPTVADLLQAIDALRESEAELLAELKTARAEVARLTGELAERGEGGA